MATQKNFGLVPQLGLILAASILASNTQAADALRLWQAMDQALASNPSIKGQVAEVKRQELEKAIASGQHLPKVDLSASYTRYAHPTLVTPIRQVGVFPPLDQDISNIGLTLSLPLYAGGKLVAGESLAEHNRIASSEALRAAGQDLLFNVATTYTKALQLKSLQKALAVRIKTLGKEESNIRQRIANGRAAKLELIRLQTQLSQARHDRLAVEQGEHDALSLLAVLLGKRSAGFELVEELAMPASLPKTKEEALAAAMSQRPEILKARALEKAAADRTEIARGERRPQVHLVSRIQTTAGGSLGQNYDDGQIGVQLSFPLFDGSIRSHRVDQAALEHRRSELQVEDLDNQMTAEVEQAFGGLSEARSRLEVAAQGEREAVEALRIERLRYDNGESTITDLLAAEAALWSATVNRLQAGFDIAVQQARLLRVTGSLSPESFKPRSLEPAKTGGTNRPSQPTGTERHIAMHRGIYGISTWLD